MEHLHTFRAAEGISDFCFAPFSRKLIFILEYNGVVNTWDLDRKGASQKFMDEGAVRATCLAFSSNSQFIACGYNFFFKCDKSLQLLLKHLSSFK